MFVKRWFTLVPRLWILGPVALGARNSGSFSCFGNITKLEYSTTKEKNFILMLYGRLIVLVVKIGHRSSVYN